MKFVKKNNTYAIKIFTAARDNYCKQNFKEAIELISIYKKYIDYNEFIIYDSRTQKKTLFTVIIVSARDSLTLKQCIDSVLLQKTDNFEIIIIDNCISRDDDIYHAQKNMLIIKAPINLFPSEGRNIGAFFARGEILIFLDDDAVMQADYMIAALKLMQNDRILGARGRVCPKTPNGKIPPHYDLGNEVCPAEFNFEGNMLVKKYFYSILNGFDPLMFGHEGREFTARAKYYFPEYQIIYSPELVVKHNFATHKQLNEKRNRQSIGLNYLNFLRRDNIKEGLTIFIHVSNLAALEQTLAALVSVSKYRPIELFLEVSASNQILKIVRNYSTFFFIYILPNQYKLKDVLHKIRYPRIMRIHSGFIFPENFFQQNFLSYATSFDNFLTNESASKEFTTISTEFVNSINKANRINLSIIIPVYNKGEYIQNTLKSINIDKYSDTEIIFIDDNSTDNSVNIIKEFKEKHANINLIINKNNLGAGASRNIGIENANGEYVFFLDADDIINSTTLRKLIKCADETHADIIRAKITGIKDGNICNVAKSYLLHQNINQPIRAIWKDEISLWFYWYFHSNLYRRSFLNKEYIRFPENVRNEDPLFLAKCFIQCPNLVLYPDIVYYYTISSSASKRADTNFLKGWAYGYYSIFQLISGYTLQRMYFLYHFPSLARHCISIIKNFDKEEAIYLLNCFSVMYKSFNKDFNVYNAKISGNLSKTKLNDYEKNDIDKTIKFAHKISGKTALQIYNIIQDINIL